MQDTNIRSIGWLNCTDGSINLTPVFTGEQHATIVNISNELFNTIRHDDSLMKQAALKELGLSA